MHSYPTFPVYVKLRKVVGALGGDEFNMKVKQGGIDVGEITVDKLL